MKENIFSKKNNFAEIAHVKSHLLYGKISDCPFPIISVIMPCYKRADTFAKSLQSVLSQDTDIPYEIVVVDNNVEPAVSPNLEVVRATHATNVFYYRHDQNLGMLGNWNRGIELARAEYITYCHDDDLLLPNCISRLMTLQAKTGKSCIMSKFHIIDENGQFKQQYMYPHRALHGILKERDYYRYTLYDQFLGSVGFGVGCLFNRQCMLELGGYNKDFYPSADYALQAAYTYYYGLYINNVPTFCYRVGVNESLSVWHLFCEADKFFRECMIEKIHLPQCWLRAILMANYRMSKIHFAIRWGNASKDLLNHIRLSDKLIMRIASFIHRYKSFEFR